MQYSEVNQTSSVMSEEPQASDKLEDISRLPKRQRGIDSRDVVRWQVKNLPSSDIVMVDGDDDNDQDFSFAGISRQTEQELDLQNRRTGKVVIEDCSATRTKRVFSQIGDNGQDQTSSTKKRLFSAATSHHISQSSGLLSPPGSGQNSPQANLRQGTPSRTILLHNLHDANSSEVVDLSRDTSTEDYGLNYAHLLTSSTFNDGQEYSETNMKPVTSAQKVAKSNLEAKGIAKSQQLRANRTALQDHQSQNHNTSSNDEGDPAENESRGSLDIEEIWNMRDIALGDVFSAKSSGNHYNRWLRHASNSTPAQARCSNYTNSQESVQELSNEQKKRNERLARVTSNSLAFRRMRKQRATTNAWKERQIQNSVKFHAPEMVRSRRQAPTSAKAKKSFAQAGIGRPMEVTNVQNMNSNYYKYADSDITAEETRHEEASSTTKPERGLSILGKSDAKPIEATGNLDLYNDLPDVGADVQLPTNSHTWSTERMQRVMRKTILMERQKDLDLIRQCFSEFAKPIATDCLTETDCSQLPEVIKFAEAVLFLDKSGKQVRDRVRSMKTRIQKRNRCGGRLNFLSNADERINEIIKLELVAKLNQELDKVNLELQEAQLKCQKDQRLNVCHQKKGNMLAAKRPKIQSYLNASKPPSKKSKRPRAWCIDDCKAQLARFESRSQTASPSEACNDIADGDATVDDYDSETSEEDEGEDLALSHHFKKDEAAVQSSSSANTESDKGRDGDRTGAPVSQRHAQAASQSILEQMVAKREQRDQSHRKSKLTPTIQSTGDKLRTTTNSYAEAGVLQEFSDCTITKSNSHDTETEQESDQPGVEREREFDDSDIDNDEEGETSEAEDENSEPVCKRYVVKAIFNGLGPDYDLDEHISGKYLQRGKAKAKVSQLANWFTAKINKSQPNIASNNHSITVKDSGTEFEQQITLSEDSQRGCRIWIEHELYNPSKEAYQNAKVQRACQPPNIWFVDWEKTITNVEVNQTEDGDNEDDPQNTETEPVNEQLSTEEQIDPTQQDGASSQHSADSHDDLEDLFASPPPTSNRKPDSCQALLSPNTSEPTSSACTVSTTPVAVERANFDALRVFTSPAEANRHAKEVFMTWLIIHLRGPGSYDYIKMEDATIEEQLERIGDRDLWMREDEFEVETEGVKVMEKYRVWVRQAKSLGWTN